jgi:hypothetical protein
MVLLSCPGDGLNAMCDKAAAQNELQVASVMIARKTQNSGDIC